MVSSYELTDHVTRQLSHRLCQQYHTILQTYDLEQYITPATLSLSKSQNQMGSWNSQSRVISLNVKLFDGYSWQEIIEVLKHEVAHQLQWEHFGYDPSQTHQLHGDVFQKSCEMIAVASWARGPRAHIHPKSPTLEELSSDTRSPWELKIKKLLSLSQSSNEHEAHLALEKAKELSEKNHLWCLNHLDSHPQIHCHSISLYTKRRTELQHFFSQILGEFFDVRPIFNYEYSLKKKCDLYVLDLIGDSKNLLTANYVYHYLSSTFDRLWQERKSHLLKKNQTASMRVAKNSYYSGLMRGFYETLKAKHQHMSSSRKSSDSKPKSQTQNTKSASGNKELTVDQIRSLSKKYNSLVDDFFKKKYPKSSRVNRRSRRRIDPDEIQAGQLEGKKISVKKAISRQPSATRLISSS